MLPLPFSRDLGNELTTQNLATGVLPHSSWSAIRLHTLVEAVAVAILDFTSLKFPLLSPS